MAPVEDFKVPNEIEPPKGSFLGLWTHNGHIKPFPHGIVFAIVGDAKRPDSVVLLRLERVKVNKLEFSCPCMQPECSLMITFTATRKGHHPPQTKSAG